VTRYLLDVNVLIALMDPGHLHHQSALAWFQIEGREAWATCAITQMGYVRVISGRKYQGSRVDVHTALEALTTFCLAREHEFWPDDMMLSETILPGSNVSSGQITDLYLLGLAYRHSGLLATFDARIPAVFGISGRRSLYLIPQV